MTNDDVLESSLATKAVIILAQAERLLSCAGNRDRIGFVARGDSRGSFR